MMLKNLFFALTILLCLGLVFGSSFFMKSYSPSIRLDKEIIISDPSGDSIHIRKENQFSTLIFSGFSDCPTVCASSLPWLERIAEEEAPNKIKVIFLDLGEKENPKENSASFLHIRKVKVSSLAKQKILEDLKLAQLGENHHSGRLFIHRMHSEKIEWVSRVDSEFYKSWKAAR